MNEEIKKELDAIIDKCSGDKEIARQLILGAISCTAQVHVDAADVITCFKDCKSLTVFSLKANNADDPQRVKNISGEIADKVKGSNAILVEISHPKETPLKMQELVDFNKILSENSDKANIIWSMNENKDNNFEVTIIVKNPA